MNQKTETPRLDAIVMPRALCKFRGMCTVKKAFEKALIVFWLCMIAAMLCIEVQIIRMHFEIRRDLREVKRITDSLQE